MSSPLYNVVLLLLSMQIISAFGQENNLNVIHCKRDGAKAPHPDFEVTSVSVNPCPSGGRWAPKACPLYRGGNATIQIKFRPAKEVTAMRAFVRGVVGGVITGFRLPEEDICLSGPACPLQAGQEYTYEATVDILEAYPVNKRVTVNWQMYDLTDGAELDADRKKELGEICVYLRTQILNKQ